MRHAALFLLVSAVAASGCGGDGALPAPMPDMAPAALPDLATAPDLLVAASGIGDPCTGGGGLGQGSCAAGQICLPPQFGFNDGYCTQMCSNADPCPSDAKCVQAQQGVRVCLLKCTKDTDCRAGVDYVCDPANKVCVPDGSGGPGAGVKPGTRNGGACVTPTVDPTPGAGLFDADVRLSVSTGNHFGAETHVAVDPMSKHVVASWIDVGFQGDSGIGYSTSLADGTQFGKSITLPTDKSVDKSGAQSDPVVAVDSAGRFFIIWIGFDRTGGGQGVKNMVLYVARSTNGGVTFADAGNLFVVAPGEWKAGGYLDKPWIAGAPDGTLYATWNRITSQNSPVDIRLSRSTDHGETWSAPITISDSAKRPDLDRNLAQITVGSDNRPAVTWVEVATQQFGSPDNAVYFQRIEADGSKKSTNVLVSMAPDSPAFDDPSVAVDGSRAYVGFISGTSKGAWDVRVASSLDGGATFAPSVKVNDDPTCATHFHHQIAVDGAGRVHAIWYDNRYLKGNLFHADSPAAGANAPLAFGPSTFVNSAPFTFTTRRDMSNWVGDYLGLTAVGNELYASWTDNRAANRSDVYFAHATLK